MRFVASVDPVDNEETMPEKQVAEVHPFSFVQLFCSEFWYANWLYLTDQQLSCLDLIQIFFLQQMQNDILQMLIVIHGDFYGVRFSQQNSLCILNVICFSSWSCTWTYLLQQALEGQRHNHTSKLLQQLHPKSVYCNSLFMRFSFFFFFFSAGFTLISTLTFLANFAKHVRGSRLIGHPSSILNEWVWQASNRRVGRFDTGCCVVEETWAPINKHSFI